MGATLAKAEAQQLVQLGRTLPANKWHDVTRINGASVYLVRAVPTERDLFC